ncbi:hypothetical protein J8273_0311 [Carpediemonas membranifera]|uniref:Uncharacterized protein n=1 Tax=Carpediemonas membranifera TaxID=201153 RepID=A0A8J6E2U2_9EUKA|nr:hypothetical protein J8273_0311 [Carpediemonas membranifera]|eukprot:KAG9395093.1 hypothetical protein J8273_0311 [Carpediemonas membranifera]
MPASDSHEWLTKIHFTWKIGFLLSLPVLYLFVMLFVVYKVVGKERILSVHAEAVAKKKEENEKADAETRQKREEKRLVKQQKIFGKKTKGKTTSDPAGKATAGNHEAKKAK